MSLVWQCLAKKAGAATASANRGVGVLEPMAAVDAGNCLGSHAEPAEKGQDTGSPT